MQDTACGMDCPFVKSGLCKSDRECCNYTESFWMSKDNPAPILVKDCAPKRTMMIHQQETSYILNLQQEVANLKNEIVELKELITSICTQVRIAIESNKPSPQSITYRE